MILLLEKGETKFSLPQDILYTKQCVHIFHRLPKKLKVQTTGQRVGFDGNDFKIIHNPSKLLFLYILAAYMAAIFSSRDYIDGPNCKAFWNLPTIFISKVCI